MKEERKQKKLKDMWNVILKDKRRCAICGTYDKCRLDAEGIIDKYRASVDRDNNVYVLIPKKDLYICRHCNKNFIIIGWGGNNPKERYEHSKVLRELYHLKRFTVEEWHNILERIRRGETIKVGDEE
jgi:hypothetical protein